MILDNLDDLHRSFADFVNEPNPPAENDDRYSARTRWFNRGREDLAKRTFFKTLLTTGTLSVMNGTASYDLPEDFEKPNGLYQMSNSAGTIIYTHPFETRGLISLSRNFATGRYQVTFSPTPTQGDTVTFWYFATPPELEAGEDLVLLDGEAVLYYALKQHYFIKGPLDKYAEARDDYENMVDELLRNNQIPPPGHLVDMQNVSKARFGTTSERTYYGGNRRRV